MPWILFFFLGLGGVAVAGAPSAPSPGKSSGKSAGKKGRFTVAGKRPSDLRTFRIPGLSPEVYVKNTPVEPYTKKQFVAAAKFFSLPFSGYHHQPEYFEAWKETSVGDSIVASNYAANTTRMIWEKFTRSGYFPPSALKNDGAYTPEEEVVLDGWLSEADECAFLMYAVILPAIQRYDKTPYLWLENPREREFQSTTCGCYDDNGNIRFASDPAAKWNDKEKKTPCLCPQKIPTQKIMIPMMLWVTGYFLSPGLTLCGKDGQIPQYLVSDPRPHDKLWPGETSTADLLARRNDLLPVAWTITTTPPTDDQKKLGARLYRLEGESDGKTRWKIPTVWSVGGTRYASPAEQFSLLESVSRYVTSFWDESFDTMDKQAKPEGRPLVKELPMLFKGFVGDSQQNLLDGANVLHETLVRAAYLGENVWTAKYLAGDPARFIRPIFAAFAVITVGVMIIVFAPLVAAALPAIPVIGPAIGSAMASIGGVMASLPAGVVTAAALAAKAAVAAAVLAALGETEYGSALKSLLDLVEGGITPEKILEKAAEELAKADPALAEGLKVAGSTISGLVSGKTDLSNITDKIKNELESRGKAALDSAVAKGQGKIEAATGGALGTLLDLAPAVAKK